MNTIAGLAVATNTIQQSLWTLLDRSTTAGTDKSLIQKPSPYTGKSSPDVHCFIVAFTLYAQDMGTKLNTSVTVGEERKWKLDDQKWIWTALSFLQDEAAVWATPYIEKMVKDEIAFPTWNDFCVAFKLRFETQDESANAKEALCKLYQSKLSVPEYVAWFHEVMACTGYSDGDLRDRFYEHLSAEIKDLLPMTEHSTRTLNELIAVATDFDTRMCQRKAEKAWEQGHSTGTTFTPCTTTTGTTFMPRTTTSASAFSAPAKDPNTMDIDASRGNGKTRQDFLKEMNGRCFGCGSKSHTKKDGGHEREICDHCLGTGHKSTVCMHRYFGLPRRVKAAATFSMVTEEYFDILHIDSPQTQAAHRANESTPMQEQDTSTLAATATVDPDFIAKLIEQQKSLEKQIEAMKKFF